MQKTVSVAVTGAAGQLGYATLARIAAGDMFGPAQKVALRLLEIPSAMHALEGIAMEIEDMPQSVVDSVTITTDAKEAFSGANWDILIGGIPRKPGQERKDVLLSNAALYQSHGRDLNEVAADDVRVLVVGNPCNTNCLVVSRAAPDIPQERFFAMTRLDENRARRMLTEHLKRHDGMLLNELWGVTIWGNHSSTQYPDAFNPWVWTNDYKPFELRLKEVFDEEDIAWVQNEFIPKVQQRGAEVLRLRGASSAISAAQAIVDSVQSLMNGTPRLESHSFGVISRGEYGIEAGLCFSYPVHTDGWDWEIVEGLKHDEFASAKIKQSEAELAEERDAVQRLLD